MYARLGNALLALSLIFVFSAGPVTSTKATGATGPIQLGGDDQNGHGESDWSDHDANPATPDVVVTVDGWKYIMLSLKGMLATEQRAGASNSIAVIGSAGSDAYAVSLGLTPNDGGASCTTDDVTDTYCMMESVKVELDRLNGAAAAPTVTYYDTAAEVTAFFNGLTAGTENVAVVFIPGDDGDNDLGNEYENDEQTATDEDEVNDDPLDTTEMEQALADSAADIAAFNAAGGGVLSSGSDHYLSWLTLLLPTLDTSDNGTTCTLAMTADGAALWTGLIDTDISECWHNHFTGDLGALKVLALGWVSWTDADSDNMIDAGEATAANWDGPDGISGNADDAQTRVVIGGAAGEAAIGEELPETNTNGDASASWALLVAALAAVAGLALRVVERKRLQA
jgi:hypothetical protein